MASTLATRFRLMTYNIGGGRDDADLALDKIAQVIREVSPDILVLQEAVEWVDADQVQHNTAMILAQALGYVTGLHYGPTLSLQQDFHPGKAIFVRGIFNDWLDFRQGNALLSRWNFVRLGDPSKAGVPHNIPLFRPVQYEGSRDTDPRYALIGRVNQGKVAPYVIGTHLSTLRGERGDEPDPHKTQQASEMRSAQVHRLLDLVREHILQRRELLFLLGDFNAAAGEACIADVLEQEGGLTRLIPQNDHTRTHLFKVDEPIDHIFVYPESRLIDSVCRIVDTPLAHEASDHLPVMADVQVV